MGSPGPFETRVLRADEAAVDSRACGLSACLPLAAPSSLDSAPSRPLKRAAGALEALTLGMQLTPLAVQKIAPATQKAYLLVLRELLGWMVLRGLPALPAEEWGPVLADFIQDLYDREESQAKASRVLAALLWAQPVIRGPIKRAFPLAAQTVAGWRRLHPGESKPPIPWLLAVSLAVWMAETGEPRAALLLVLCFLTYCRPSEGLLLTWGQVLEPMADAPGVLGCVTIVLNPQALGQPSKTGLFDTNVVLDLPSHLEFALCLVALKRGRSPAERVCPLSYPQLLRLMHHGAAALRSKALRPTPHGLRHGGASHDRACGYRGLLEIQARGAWKAASSMMRYEKHSRIVQQLEALGPSVLRDLRSREARWPAVCAKICGRR